jgi:DNA-binding response OmpR family regulator
MNILVVDDCPSIRLLVSKYLKQWGFEPVLAADGIEAMAILVEPDAPRLLIIDWMMPVITGPKLIEEFRKHDTNRDCYIIMLTSKTGEEVLETVFRCGADDYLNKPIEFDELRRRIEQGQRILERQDSVIQKFADLTPAPSATAQVDSIENWINGSCGFLSVCGFETTRRLVLCQSQKSGCRCLTWSRKATTFSPAKQRRLPARR